jgi:hypothetical protein
MTKDNMDANIDWLMFCKCGRTIYWQDTLNDTRPPVICDGCESYADECKCHPIIREETIER